jgi:hypothetical protein
MTRGWFLGMLLALPFFPWGKKCIPVDTFALRKDENGEIVVVELGTTYEYW